MLSAIDYTVRPNFNDISMNEKHDPVIETSNLVAKKEMYWQLFFQSFKFSVEILEHVRLQKERCKIVTKN